MQLVLFCVLCIVCVKCVPIVKKDVESEPQCGVEASPNPLHHNPWLVYLEYFSPLGPREIRCAGTLISKRHVVTAAHCVRRGLFTKLQARLGEYDVTATVDSAEGLTADPLVRVAVSAVRIHEGYDGNKDDIAVLVLEHDAPYTDFIRPACLPTEANKKGDLFTAAGWGEETFTHMFSHVKKNISLPSWSYDDCNTVYKRFKLPKNVICAGGEDGIDTCRGDSGGPLTLKRQDKTGQERVELHGVTSSGNVICGRQGSPGVYTSVLGHLQWIKNVIKSNS